MFRYTRLSRFRTLVPAVQRPLQRPFSSRFLRSPPDAQVQSVRVRSPGLTPRRLATWALYSGCVAGYFVYLMPDIEVEVEEVQVEGVAGPEADEDDDEESEFADEDSTFIPLTWARKLPRTYYKGSDPEWQEFQKIAKDQNKHKAIHKELVGVIFDGTLQHPMIARQIGQDPKVGKVWLYINFPDGPPQEYIRQGIEIADDYVALSAQRISPEQYHRMTSTLWPAAALSSLYATAKVLFNLNYQRARDALGIESKPAPGSPEAKYQNLLQVIAANQSKTAGDLGKTQTDPGASVAASDDKGMKSATREAARSSDAQDTQRIPWTIKAPLPVGPMDIPIAFHVFQHNFMQKRMPTKMEPPRGSLVVSGLVEVKGSRARVLYDIQAFFDPKQNRFVTVNATVRNLKRWSQPPKGGR